MTEATVYDVIKKYITRGIDICQREYKRTPPTPSVVTKERAAKILALARSEPPEGYPRWTTLLLRQKLIELGVLDSIGRETLRSTLRKNNISFH